ncbi:MAG: GNAT family N-acetyltransferase [Planctomycetia bacterium]|nr:GNAT family N-acetyltransferase [Planctomycetia bacterium]
MDVDLRRCDFGAVQLPSDYYLEAWSRSLLDSHALAHYLSFRDEIDTQLFVRFRSFKGARGVMESIVRHRNFCPEATWLIVYHPKNLYMPQCCATIQGLVDDFGFGGIQNVGVVPEHRGKGLGRALLQLALQGYQRLGLHRANLDVTAENLPAINLYKAMGFQIVQTYQKVCADSLKR